MKNKVAFPSMLLGLLLAAGCGGGGSGSAPLAQAPTISAQPQALIVTAGQPASFSVTATGTAPLAYQWRRNGGALSGATAPTYPIAAATSGDAGSYDVVVSNAAGSVTSAAATLTVNPVPVGPSISAQPQSQTVVLGQPASFSVTATGTAPLAYQWRRNGGALSGATGPTYAIAAAAFGDAGSYDVVVSNAVSSLTSSAATLTVNPAPVVTVAVSPSPASVGTGASLTFTATVTGSPNTAVTWSVQETGGGGIASNGRYTAPSTPGTYHVVATAAADPSKFDAARVDVFAAGSLRLYQVGLPAGLFSPIQIAGPGGFSAVLSQSDQAFSGVPVGDYAFTIPSVVAGGVTFLPVEPGPAVTKTLALNGSIFFGVSFAPQNPTGVGSIASGGSALRDHIDPAALLLPNGHVLFLGGLGAAPEDYNPGAGTYASLPSPAVPRGFETPAALLADGKVILAGGGYPSPVATTEVYDPVLQTWSTVGPLASPRFHHTVTTLQDGRVLAVGGEDPSGLLATAELYDPATQTWSPTAGAPSQARRYHTATLLANGKVLLAGGYGGPGALNSAELFDPAMGRFTLLASTMASAHYYHAAVRLPSGKVVLVGGFGTGDYVLPIEVFTPGADAFTSPASLRVPRTYLSAAALLDGRVFINGGMSGGDATASTELFDPVAGTVVFGPNLSVSRQEHQSLTLPDGRVYVVGGRGLNNTARRATDLFTP